MGEVGSERRFRVHSPHSQSRNDNIVRALELTEYNDNDERVICPPKRSAVIQNRAPTLFETSTSTSAQPKERVCVWRALCPSQHSTLLCTFAISPVLISTLVAAHHHHHHPVDLSTETDQVPTNDA